MFANDDFGEETVRHGRWIGSGEDVYCSECRNHPLKDIENWKVGDYV